MTYIGAEPDAAFTTTAKQTITGTGVATYTLDHDVSNESDIRVYVDNVHQEGGTGKAYTVDGNQITFTENITSSMDCYVIFSAMALQTTAPAADSISTGMIKDGAVTSAKLDGLTSSDMPTGSVLQVVSNSYSTSTSITSTTKGSGTSTGLTATITPKSTSNKLLLMGTVHFACGYNADPALSIEIYDGTNIVYTDQQWAYYFNGDGNEAYNFRYPIHAYIDAPAISATTYTVRAWKSGTFTAQSGSTSNPSILTIMEIAG